MTSKENQTNNSNYKMDHDERGIALIININKYDPNPFDDIEGDNNPRLRLLFSC